MHEMVLNAEAWGIHEEAILQQLRQEVKLVRLYDSDQTKWKREIPREKILQRKKLNGLIELNMKGYEG